MTLCTILIGLLSLLGFCFSISESDTSRYHINQPSHQHRKPHQQTEAQEGKQQSTCQRAFSYCHSVSSGAFTMSMATISAMQGQVQSR